MENFLPAFGFRNGKVRPGRRRAGGLVGGGGLFVGKILFVLGTAFTALAGEVVAGEDVVRPNILWLVSEDNTAGFVGAYGDPLARTPHLDRLAGKGIVFERAYAAAPVCAPSRSTIITGRYATALGTQHMRSRRPLPENVKFFPEFLRAAGYFCTNNAKTDYNTSTPFAQAWDENGKEAHWRHRRPGQPFFAVFNTELSHESRLFTREPLVTDTARVRVPAYLPDTPEVRADLAQYYDCVSRADEAVGRILAQLEEDGLAEDTIVFYYSDHGGALPRSKRFLYENGTHAALIVCFPAKFRSLAPAAPGGRVGKVVSFVDLAPTVLRLAGLPQPAQFQGHAFAGRNPEQAPELVYMFRDRMDERYDLSRAVTDGRFRYVRHYLPHRPAGQHLHTLWRSFSMRRWEELYRAGGLAAAQQAFFEPKPAEELFDVLTDPDNINNLASDSAHRDTLERLRTANRAHLLRIRDSGFLPEAMMLDLADGRSPAVVTADSVSYPLDRMLALIDACQMGEADAALVSAAIRDPLAMVRYWGIIAGLSLPETSDPALLLDDPDPSVRVATAEAVLRRGPSAAAWRVLGEALEPRQPAELRLAVLNALAFLPPGPDFLRPLIESAAEEKPETKNDEYVPRAARYLIETLAFSDQRPSP